MSCIRFEPLLFWKPGEYSPVTRVPWMLQKGFGIKESVDQHLSGSHASVFSFKGNHSNLIMSLSLLEEREPNNFLSLVWELSTISMDLLGEVSLILLIKSYLKRKTKHYRDGFAIRNLNLPLKCKL